MSSPLIPPLVEALRHRPFSFYPPILNIEHNQWQYRRATWSEILVVNARTGLEVWIPRRFLGELSHIEDPAVIVSLLKELEYKDGAVGPYQHRVIEMPAAVSQSGPPPSAAERGRPAPVVGIRLESKSESHVFRMVGGALVLGIVAAYVAVNFYRDGFLRPRISYSARDRSYAVLTADDDYTAVLRKLGTPAQERWQGAAGGTRYHALWYPDQACTVVLMAAAGREATYLGTLGANGDPVHWVRIAGVEADSLLRELTRPAR